MEGGGSVLTFSSLSELELELELEESEEWPSWRGRGGGRWN